MDESRIQVGDSAMVMRLAPDRDPDDAALGDVVEVLEVDEDDEDGLYYFAETERGALWFYGDELYKVEKVAEFEIIPIEEENDMNNERELDRLHDRFLEPSEELPVAECDCCNQPIYDGETAYDMDGELFCDLECLANRVGAYLVVIEGGER